MRRFGNLCLIFLTILGFTACGGSGDKGAGESAGDKGTTGGSAALMTDSCEKPENVANPACQWVAKEMNIDSQNSNKAVEHTKVAFQYDADGRVTRAEGGVNGQSEALMTMIYVKEGLSKMMNYGSPKPPGSGNWTSETATNVAYNPDGTKYTVKTEDKRDGKVTGGTYEVFSSLPTGSGSIYTATDAANQQTAGSIRVKTVDPSTQRPTTNSEFGIVPNKNDLLYWTQSTFTYSPEGKLTLLVVKRQDCTTVKCGANNTYPVDPATIIDTTSLTTTQVLYDEKNRLKGFAMSSYNDYKNKPDQIDNTMTCEMVYDMDTGAKIAYKHPLDSFLDLFGGGGNAFPISFTTSDVFKSWSCKMNGASDPAMTMSFTWARLWEVQPDGRAP